MNASAPDENKLVLTIPTVLNGFKYGTTAFFTLGILLFFLPFINIRCNDVRLAKASGIQIATGFKVEPTKELENIGNIFGRDEKGRNNDEQRLQRDKDTSLGDPASKKPGNGRKDLGPNYFMIAAFVMGISGAIVSLIRFRDRWALCSIIGWLGVLSFFLTIFSVLQQTREFRLDLGMIRISVNFTFWFFLSLASFIVATLFSHKERNREWSEAKQKEINEYISSFGYDQNGTVSDNSST